jgi:DNA repair protein RecN (Recombination protein N)
MLTYLRIRGLALLDDVELELGPGLNVLTGETGAGKSIIVGALSLLRGARARVEVVREGDDTATVDAQFEPRPAVHDRLQALLDDVGVESTFDEGLLVRRTVPRTGRSRSFLQATLSTQAALGRVGELLLDICSQHEHHFLTMPARHLEVLDAYAGLATAVTEHARRHGAWRDAAARLEHLRRSADQGLSRGDFLRFQIDEIEAVDPQPGEHEALRRQVSLMRDVQRWVQFATEAQDALYESDDAIAGRLAVLLERARGGTAESELLSQMEEQLAAAQVACEEAARMAERFSRELDVDPADLDEAETRLDELDRLCRKHGVDADELAARLSTMREELEAIDNADEVLAHQLAVVEAALEACVASADGLHRGRTKAAAGLAKAVEAEFGALHLAGARLQVAIESGEELPGPRGRDDVQFLFSANPGEPLAPLSRVASGGELSRVLLAIKGALASGDQVATYVFDEVDAGVGGEVAEAIGRRLRSAANDHQVLCVTHLPQIAAFADAHFHVDKHTEGGRTRTRVRRLSDDERTDELARMLGGAKKSAREHAAQLLADAVPAAPKSDPHKKPGKRRTTRAQA